MVVVILIWALPLPGGDLVKWFSGSISVIAVAYKSISVFLRNNLGEWFKNIDTNKVFSQFRLPSYGEHRGLAVEIHQTLGYLSALQLGQIGREKTLLLVVDDLDRCSVNTVKEVFDAVRLVTDIPRVITLVAIDERMAFAAVEKHYDQFGHAGRTPAHVAREYLGKILQASITLPVVDDEYVQRFVEDVLFPEVRKERIHRSYVEYSVAPEIVSMHSSEPVQTATEQGRMPPEQASSVNQVKVEQLPVTNLSALPEEMDLFRELAVDYGFRNPREMGRLYLSWRLLKALLLGGRAYAFNEVENHMRLLFWREYRLQQNSDDRKKLDAWLAGSYSTFGSPEHLVPALGALKGAMIGSFIGGNWEKTVELTDAILLPASSAVLKT